MKDINFLSSNGKESSDHSKPRQYDIEYTSPAAESVQPVAHSKKHWFNKQKESSPVPAYHIPMAPPPPIHARPVPTQAVMRKTAPTAQSNQTQTHRAQPGQTRSIRPRSIPVAPPAPLKPTAPPRPIVSRPPVTTPAPAMPLRTNSTVHTQRVADIKGKETNPERITKGSLGVNLLPQGVSEQHSKDASSTRLLKVTFTTLGIVTLVYFGMVMYQSYFISQTKQVYDEIQVVEQDIYAYRDLQTQINELNDSIEQVTAILDSHIYWTRFFAQLEQYTLPNVHYSAFSGDISGQINLQAVTTDFGSVSRQMAVFEQAPNFVLKASTNTATRSTTAETEETSVATEAPADSPPQETQNPVSFAISLQVNPDIFYYQTNESR